MNINDPRLRIVERVESVSGIINCTEAMLFGTGEYSLLLLDKDRLHGDCLDEFIKILIDNKNVFGGYCIHNKDSNDGRVYIEKNILKNMFMMRHPSGYFFKKNILYNVLNNFSVEELIISPFGSEYFMAEAAIKGPLLVYDKLLVDTETLNECRKIKSYTYSKNKENIFFFPKMQIYNMLCFLRFLDKLGLNDRMKDKVAAKLLTRFLSKVTVEYRAIMRNISICEHYHIKSENVGHGTMLKWAMHMYWEFMNSNFNKKSRFRLAFTVARSFFHF